MRYTKPPLTFDQQADLLLYRGMTGDRDAMIKRLAVVNYYRLSGYWYPFRLPGTDKFKDGTAFDDVWERYVFDRQLRLLTMDAIERIEVAIRTQLANALARRNNDPFEYATDSAALPDLSEEKRTVYLEQIRTAQNTSRETFVAHFRKKYSPEHEYMPVWMACEIMTFGCVLTLFRGAPAAIKKQIATHYSVQDTVLNSWLLALNTVRNVCAHHGRLWNREIGTKPKIPKRDTRWIEPVEIGNNRVFGMLSICKYCIDIIAPQSAWPDRLCRLLDNHPNIPLRSMGVPENWTDSRIWQYARRTHL